MAKNPNHTLDDYEKQFYDEDENILPQWEFPYVTWGDNYNYYPDGKPRPKWKEAVWNSDFGSSTVALALTGKEKEVIEWRKTEERWQKQYGISYTERVRETRRREELERRKRLGYRD